MIGIFINVYVLMVLGLFAWKYYALEPFLLLLCSFHTDASDPKEIMTLKGTLFMNIFYKSCLTISDVFFFIRNNYCLMLVIVVF